MTIDVADLFAEFADPPAAVRPMGFWIWNGEMNEGRITEMLTQFKERGFGGVFVHPRPGLITEYLSERWFDLFRFALAECERLGMECHIYDENSFPSGFGGGHVPATDPTTMATCVEARTHHGPPPIHVDRKNLLLACRAPQEEGERIKPLPPGTKLDEAITEGPIITFEMRQATCDWWNGGFSYVDLTRPETTRAFLQTTHERYEKEIGASFGKQVKYVFTDEPNLPHGNGLTLSRYLLREFEREHGYDLIPRLPDLFFDTPDSLPVRYDYHATRARLFAENFARPIHDWCEAHGLQFTGHFNEHEWPFPGGNPDSMAMQRWMQAPGIDLLGFQFDPNDRAKNGLYRLTILEVMSVARQLGRERVLCESCGGGGYNMTPAQFKPLEDFLLVHGVNVIVPHLSYQTLAGARKYDWAQTISDHAPWWDEAGTHYQHIARMGWAATRGKTGSRVLVLHPTETGWLYHTPGKRSLKLEALRASQSALVDALAAAQIDFDLGCEAILAEMGKVQGNLLTVGHGEYNVVIVPSGMETMRPETATLLMDFLNSGGDVLAVGLAPNLLNGHPSEQGEQLQSHKNWQRCDSVEELILRGKETYVYPFDFPLVSTPDDNPLPNGVEFAKRDLGDERYLYLFANPWTNGPIETRIKLENQSLYTLDTLTGKTLPVTTEKVNGGQIANLVLPAGGHAVFLAEPWNENPFELPGHTPVPVIVGEPTAARIAPNVLVLDYCDLTVGNKTFPGLNTISANKKMWQAQGFERDVWEWSIQYRRMFVDHPIPPDSAFAVEYRFTVDADAVPLASATLMLAVERPHLYRITVNGHLTLPDAFTERWFDEDIRRAHIGPLVHAGENVIRLVADPFHMLCEIAPVYVLGSFSLRDASPGFTIGPAQPIRPGDWRDHGMRFYPWGVRYSYPITLDAPADRLTVQLAEWHGSAARVALDGHDLGTILYPPYTLTADTPLDSGAHTLTVTVKGNLKNMMGPFFNDGLPGPWSWYNSPETPPDGPRYRFYETGMKQIEVRAEKRNGG